MNQIQVRTIPGSYANIPDMGLRFTTRHLNNPGVRQVPHMSRSWTVNQETVQALERLAAMSDEGLQISTYFQQAIASDPTPVELLKLMAATSDLVDLKWPGFSYCLPDGSDAAAAFKAENSWPTQLYRLKRHSPK